MSHFAKIEPTANSAAFTVTNVIVADQSFIDSGLVGDPKMWIQTSYNTHGNVHYAPSPPAEPFTPDGGVPLRGNHAGIGYIYDKAHDVFYTQQPFSSWHLNQSTWLWEAPVEYPKDGANHYWDEPTLSWKPVPVPARPE